jgi:hypothetical protein
MIDKWEADGRPGEGSFQWTPPTDHPDFRSFSTLVWSEAKTWRRKPGPKTRYRWVKERSPMIVLAVTPDDILYIGVRGTSTDLEWVSNMRFVPVPLTIGGAVATLLSVSLLQSDWFKGSGLDVAPIYLYGSPSVGQTRLPPCEHADEVHKGLGQPARQPRDAHIPRRRDGGMGGLVWHGVFQ